MTVVGGLSIPMMNGWKVELNDGTTTIMTDKSKTCVFDAKLGDVGCPRIIIVHYDGTSISTAVKVRPPCNVYVPITDKPVGSDNVAGVRINRYHSDLSDCKAKHMIIPPGVDLSGTSVLWYPKHGGNQIAIIGMDGNNGPRINIDKLRYALSHSEWVG